MRGWRDEEASYDMQPAAPIDERLVAWCLVAVRRAYEATCTAARAAAVQGGQTAEWGAAQVAGGALGMAGEAIGEAEVDADGEPSVRLRDGNAVEGVRMRYKQLQRARCSGIDETVETWAGEGGEWLRAEMRTMAASAHGGHVPRWTARTRRQFKAGSGAAGRKEVVMVAAASDGRVYLTAPPAAWPWRVEYEVRVRTAAAQGSHEQWVRAVVRLGRGGGGEMAAAVSVIRAQQDGRAMPRAQWERAVTRVQEGERDAGLEEMFWTHGWRGARQAAGGMRQAIWVAAQAAAGGEATGWTALRRVLGGEVPRLVAPERAAEKQQREAAQEKAAAAARARADARAAADAAAREEAAEGRRAKDGDGGVAARRMADAARVLGVEMVAEEGAVRKAYLTAALHAHPDKGGEAARFREIQAAYELMVGATQAERQGIAAAPTEGREAAGRAAAAREAERAAAAAAKAAQRETEEAAAMMAASWQPAWRTVAAALREAREAYMAAWQRYQRRKARRRELEETRDGYKSATARRAARAVERREARAKQTAAAEAAAVAAMRSVERRAMERMTAARIWRAEELREFSGRAFLEAVVADRTALETCYVVRVPYALLCRGADWATAEYADSDEYEEYRVTRCCGNPGKTSGPGQVWVTLERERATRPLQRDTWDCIVVRWDLMAGMERYGAHQCGIEIVRREEDDGGETDEEERALERAEVRRAKRIAAQAQMERVSAASEAAAEAAKQAAAMGADEEAAGGEEAAAEAAWWQEEAAAEAHAAEEDTGRDAVDALLHELGVTSDEEAGSATEAEGEEADEAGKVAGESSGELRRRRAGWNGAHWWQGAWMGAVATAEYGTARSGRQPALPPQSAAAQRAHAAAMRVSGVAATVQERDAAREAAREAGRRGKRLWQATEVAAEAREEAAAVEEVAEALQAWRTRRGLPLPGKAATTAEMAAAAAAVMQRARPAANAAAAARRAGVLRELAQLAEAEGALESGGLEEAAAAVRAAMGGAADGAASTVEAAMVAALVQGRAAEAEARRRRNEQARPREVVDGLRIKRRRWSTYKVDEGDDGGAGMAAAAARNEGAAAVEEGTAAGAGAAVAAAAVAAGVRAAWEAERRPLGSVEIGKVTGPRGRRVPTTPAAVGVRDVLANRDDVLGCVFLIPQRFDGRMDEAQRASVVRAEAMHLAALEAGAWRGAPGEAVVRIAAGGPGRDGWRVRGHKLPVQLQVSEKVMRRDPCGEAKWKRVEELGEEVERGGSIRLLCHCRWTRREHMPECRACHGEPLAKCIERVAARRRVAATEEAARGAALAELAAAEREEATRVDLEAVLRTVMRQTMAGRAGVAEAADGGLEAEDAEGAERGGAAAAGASDGEERAAPMYACDVHAAGASGGEGLAAPMYVCDAHAAGASAVAVEHEHVHETGSMGGDAVMADAVTRSAGREGGKRRREADGVSSERDAGGGGGSAATAADEGDGSSAAAAAGDRREHYAGSRTNKQSRNARKRAAAAAKRAAGDE